MNFSQISQPVSYITERLLPDIDETDNKEIPNIISTYKIELDERTNNHLGYPYNLKYDYSEIRELFDFSINNLGDPFIESNYKVHSRKFEIAVLDWFAKLWNISKDEYWGYITSCGTEGNLHGIYLGRENMHDGILYASCNSHYSVFKAAKMFKIPCEKIMSNDDGTINLDDLENRIEKNKDFPVIMNINIGTTLKGGIDDLDSIINLLYKLGYSNDRFYIHCDGALVGLMLSLIENEYISFSKKPISSVSVSGHKFIGSPVPCGVIITRLNYIKNIANNIDYINSRDATLTGSRSGIAPLYMWYTLVKKGISGIKREVEECIENAKYLANELILHKVENVLLNKWSNTVVFKEPENKKLIDKWQLACSNCLCHIIVMQNISKEKINLFIRDYINNNL